MRELIIGVRVSAITPDSSTAPARVNANSVNSTPVSPPWKPIGRYTAISVVVIATTGHASSRAPRIEASNGVIPSSMCRWMFSSTMIASSTTMPIASTIASRVSRLMVKPISNIRNNAPISDSGMVTAGISTLRSEPRNRKITTITMISASTIVLMTSLIASWIASVLSYGMVALMPCGSCGTISPSQTLRTSLMTSSEFASGATKMPMKVADSPLMRTEVP